MKRRETKLIPPTDVTTPSPTYTMFWPLTKIDEGDTVPPELSHWGFKSPVTALKVQTAVSVGLVGTM